jgi:transposase
VTTGEEDATRAIIVGVDTHKDVHVAVAIDLLGVRLDEFVTQANAGGYSKLEQWARALGRPAAFGVEGTASYGQGLSSYLSRRGHRVIEVNRADRSARRRSGKSDPLDAEAAARAVLSGVATAIPKLREGAVEMIRVLKVAKDSAVKARSQAMITLKALLVTVPDELRESVTGLTDLKLVEKCTRLQVRAIRCPQNAACSALRSLARRWKDLDREIKAHLAELDRLTSEASPAMVAAFGIGSDTAAEMLLVAGDNPSRIHSEAAFAALCGVCPIPASSGKTSRHRLNRGGHRQANAALYRVTIVRMRWHQPTIDYVARRTAEGKTKAEIIRCLKRYVAREIFGYLRSGAAKLVPAAP